MTTSCTVIMMSGIGEICQIELLMKKILDNVLYHISVFQVIVMYYDSDDLEDA